MQSPPFVFRVTDENGTHFEGYAIDVFEEISRRLDLAFRYIPTSHSHFGVRLANGTWTGIVGDIMCGVRMGAFSGAGAGGVVVVVVVW